METQVEEAQPSAFTEGLVVERSSEPSKHGTVLKREGQRLRVDFSKSGGRASEWLSYKELRIVDPLRLSFGSDLSDVSDPDLGITVFPMSDVANARFCTKCNTVFELHTEEPKCPGSHAIYRWTKTIPDDFRIVKAAPSRPPAQASPQCGGAVHPADELGSVAEVAEIAEDGDELSPGSDPDMDRDGGSGGGGAGGDDQAQAKEWTVSCLLVDKAVDMASQGFFAVLNCGGASEGGLQESLIGPEPEAAMATPPGIDPESDARFIELFRKLHDASSQFRQQVVEIEERYHKPILVREMQMSVDEFEFKACWRWECHIEIRTAGMTDAEVGGLIAFETTNGYQTAKFEAVRDEFKQATTDSPRPRVGSGAASAAPQLLATVIAPTSSSKEPQGQSNPRGGYQHWPADPASEYAKRMETIEQEGIDLCKAVLEEARANSDEITEKWCRYGTDDSRSWHRIGMGALAQDYYDSHFEYWRQDCIKNFMAGYPDKASYVAARMRCGEHPPLNPDAPPTDEAGATAPPGSTQRMAWLCARRAAAGAPPVPGRCARTSEGCKSQAVDTAFGTP
eukprot:COSAG04_NODE_102_length_26175_cov_14.250163_12_plen_566_part_00